ncbi:MAG TPA: phosphatase PAP2 family protein, partial [Myxococcales bacterium]|nr:phosphatase PAP2 family protein [Myxococcales bacterium]
LYLWPIIVGGVLYFQKRHLAFRNFLSSFVLAGYIGYVGYCLVPVVGPVFYYGPSHLHETENSEQSSNLEALGGDSESGLFVDLTYQFNTVRSGSKAPRNCFPSLHTAWGVILLATLWMSLRKLFWICLWPIALMILATVSLRLHYFVDVVAGLLVALLALSLMPRINAWWQKHSPVEQDSKALTDAEKPGPAWRLWLSLLSTLVFCGGVAAYLHSPLAEVPSLEAQEQDFLAGRFLSSVPKEARGPAIPLANRSRLVGISYAPRALNPRDSLRIKIYFQSPQKVTHEMQIKYVIS